MEKARRCRIGVGRISGAGLQRADYKMRPVGPVAGRPPGEAPVPEAVSGRNASPYGGAPNPGDPPLILGRVPRGVGPGSPVGLQGRFAPLGHQCAWTAVTIVCCARPAHAVPAIAPVGSGLHRLPAACTDAPAGQRVVDVRHQGVAA